MRKVLALDLGTASIGWAIREKQENPSALDIVDRGVLIFSEGFGLEKNNPYSLAAKRRKHRLDRRKYYRRRLRKLAVLLVLVEHGMVPLSLKEVKAWIKPAKGQKAAYPVSAEFHNWLRLKPKKGPVTGPQFTDIYQLRAAAVQGRLSDFADQGFSEAELLGRIIYNYAQRRGFKSNAKQIVEDSGKVKTSISKLKEEMGSKLLAEYFAELNPVKDRIRERYVAREMYVEEFEAVCNRYPKVLKPLQEDLHEALFMVRPLKSQKSNVGNCSFEPKKKRIHLSHPAFERFRLVQFLQNVRIAGPDKVKYFLPKDILDRVADRIIAQAEDKFDKKDLAEWISLEMGTEVKIATDNKFPARGCPVSHAIQRALGPEWRDRTLERTYRKHGKEQHKAKIGYLDIWHYLKDLSEKVDKGTFEASVKDYAREIGLDPAAAEALANCDIPAGYASLSLNAIRRILPWMEEGQPYHLAVLIAGVQRVLGESRWMALKDDFITDLSDFYDGLPLEQALAKTYNHFLDELKSAGLLPGDEEVHAKFMFFLGKKQAKEFPKSLVEDAAARAVDMIGVATADPEKASFKPSPSLGEFVRQRTRDEFLTEGRMSQEQIDKMLGRLYHHSAIDKWKEAEEVTVPVNFGKSERRVLQLPTPYTGSIQNPAVMRTLHELKKLVNFLLREGKIDPDTSIVVEMARELNDMNKMTAIRQWQEARENERLRILEFLAEEMKIQSPTEEQIRSVDLWLDQVQDLSGDDRGSFLDKQVRGTKVGKEKSNVLATKITLWKEQMGVCMYSGKQISISEVLHGTVEIEHTIPRSLSNDTRLENLTLATREANKEKGNRIPFQLQAAGKHIDGYEQISLRLQPWRDRLEALEDRIKRTSQAVRRLKAVDKEGYDAAVVRRWLLRFERDYWREKLRRFEIEEVDSGFARRQLVDTQVITKYAAGWLRTIFKHVRGAKPSLVAMLRKYWGLQSLFDQKDRSNHTHHLVDALVLACLDPGTYNQLAHYHRNIEQMGKNAYMPLPWPGFRSDVQQLCDGTLVRHVFRSRTFVHTKKKIKGKSGHSFTSGKGIRASLHKETALGWIKPPGQDDPVFVKRVAAAEMKNPVYAPIADFIKARKSELKGTMRMMPVLKLRLQNGRRIPIAALSEDRLPDLAENDVNRFFLSDVAELGLEEVKAEGFFLPLRKVRVVTAATNPLAVRNVPEAFANQSHPEKTSMYYEDGENFAIAIYRHKKGKAEGRIARIVSYFDLAEAGNAHPFESSIIEKGKEYFLETAELGPQIFQKGQAVLLFQDSPTEIWEDTGPHNLFDRLYIVKGIKKDRRITLLHHQHTGIVKDDKGKPGKTPVVSDKWVPSNLAITRILRASKLNALIEGVDFKLNYDGSIERL